MNDFWDRFDWAGMVQKVVIALLILVITYFLAKGVKWAIAKLVRKVPALQRQNPDGGNLGDSIGQIGSLLVWLFGLVAILQVFALAPVLEPISNMLQSVMQYLPNLIGAGFVFFIGFMVAKIVRQLVTTALRAANVDRFVGKLATASPGGPAAGAHAAPPAPSAPSAPTAAGADQPSNGGAPQSTGQFAVPPQQGPGGQPGPVPPAQQQWNAPPAGGPRRAAVDEPMRISTIVGSVLFGVILIVVGIASLQILGISAISDPAEEMLTIILNAIPLILAAGIILGLGYVIARFVGGLLEPALRAAGADRAAHNLELLPEGRSASALLTMVAKIAIMLFFAVAATRMLGFAEITAILDEVLRIGGRVLFGVAIIAAGYLVAQVISRMFDGTARQIAKYGILVLFAAIGLRYMGLADSIVNLAFGALVVSAGLAAAIAFGIGGRDAAARRLQRLEQKAE